MKTRITVSWAHTVEIEVDPVLMAAGDSAYIEKIKQEAEAQARKDLNLHDSLVTDCEDFPDIAD